MIKLFDENQNMMLQFQQIVNNKNSQNKNTFTEALITTLFSEDTLQDIQQKYYQKDTKLTNKQEDSFIKYLNQLTNVQIEDKNLNPQVSKQTKIKKEMPQDDLQIIKDVQNKQQKRKQILTLDGTPKKKSDLDPQEQSEDTHIQQVKTQKKRIPVKKEIKDTPTQQTEHQKNVEDDHEQTPTQENEYKIQNTQLCMFEVDKE